jgi:archaellum component FlaC
MAKKSAKKAAGEDESPTSTNGTANTSIYESALDELKTVADNDAARRKVETGPLREGRGQDVLRLHTTLRAIDTTYSNLSTQVAGLQEQTGENFDKTWEAVTEKFDKTWNTSEENFEKTWKDLQSKFDKTWESIGTNFDATNERTKREIHDLREEMTKVLDRRFTHIDQTFASIRADIEVLKALQMELIKERIGRPELVKR